MWLSMGARVGAPHYRPPPHDDGPPTTTTHTITKVPTPLGIARPANGRMTFLSQNQGCPKQPYSKQTYKGKCGPVPPALRQ